MEEMKKKERNTMMISRNCYSVGRCKTPLKMYITSTSINHSQSII